MNEVQLDKYSPSDVKFFFLFFFFFMLHFTWMTYFDPHVWEDLSQQQKLKKKSQNKKIHHPSKNVTF